MQLVVSLHRSGLVVFNPHWGFLVCFSKTKPFQIGGLEEMVQHFGFRSLHATPQQQFLPHQLLTLKK